MPNPTKTSLARAGLLLMLAGSGHAAAAAAEPAAAGGLFQVFFGLGIVLLLIGAVAWAARRFGRLPAGVDHGLRMLGGMSIGARERVVLIQVGETQLLLGVAPGRVQTLHVLAQPLPLSPAAPGGDLFAQRLATLLKSGWRR